MESFYRKNIIRNFNILLISIILVSCGDDLLINTNKNTYYDDIADITYLNGYIFSTNYDLSGNAGSQIDILKFEMNADSIFYITDNYALEMNGQGYFAITNDGTDLYLQSKNSYLIVKYSPIGEKAYTRWDTITINWQPCGLAYQSENDSLIVLYRNLDNLSLYRVRTISKELSIESSRDEILKLDFIDTCYGVYAMAYNNSSFYMLGVDTTHTDILIILDYDLNITEIDILSDSTVIGLCFIENDLYLSYRDKRIEKWKSY
ncbi:MAG: hypothetical protein IIB95_04035 [Candidatus Marinimicrobia bacterium]|nr:hypothetical protein [Candidatus Neomarinimicrobiota bacterium]